MDIEMNKAIRTAVETGEVRIGLRETKKAYVAGTLKLVVVAKNCPGDFTDEIELWDVPIHRTDATNLTLGSICGKPFNISILGIVDPGESQILRSENP